MKLTNIPSSKSLDCHCAQNSGWTTCAVRQSEVIKMVPHAGDLSEIGNCEKQRFNDNYRSGDEMQNHVDTPLCW